MSNAPHVHTVDEVHSNIAKIEHNSTGQGPGPSGKRGGPPTGIETGSVAVRNTGTGVLPTHKGSDWISGSGSE